MICVKNLNLSKDNNKFLEDISFTLNKKEVLAVLGESGSGKSLLAKSLIRLLNKSLKLQALEYSVDGEDVLGLNDEKLRKLRTKLALVLQDAHLSFYPSMDIGSIFNIVLKTHSKLNTKQIKEKSLAMFEYLGLKNLDLLWHSYAYELSVGMARRISLALALVCEPNYLICDEINASLDKENENKIYKLLTQLKEEKGIILISHDLNLIKNLSDKIIILEKGKLIRSVDTKSFFEEDNLWLKIYKEFYA